jgi:ElaB/YqjD/DUF883 family membrane-anchored ribosome-binding protein
MSNELTTNKEGVVDTLRRLVSESDEFLQATVGETTQQAREARARFEKTVERSKQAFHKLEALGLAGARSADRTIRAHPYEAMGIAFGLGLLIGVLAGRKD